MHLRLLTLALACSPLLGFAQVSSDAQFDLAHVGQAQGKYVFCYSQPTAAYDVAFTFSSSYTPSESMTLSTLVSGCLASAQLEAGAQLKPYDAILIQAGQRDVAIKFRDNVPAAERDLARVAKVQGKPVFIFAEPVAAYQVGATEKISWYNHAFGGNYYTIGKVEENLLKTVSKKYPSIEAIIFGETASYINFKKS